MGVTHKIPKYKGINTKLVAKIPSGEYLKEKHLLICDISMYTFLVKINVKFIRNLNKCIKMYKINITKRKLSA